MKISKSQKKVLLDWMEDPDFQVIDTIIIERNLKGGENGWEYEDEWRITAKRKKSRSLYRIDSKNAPLEILMPTKDNEEMPF